MGRKEKNSLLPPENYKEILQEHLRMASKKCEAKKHKKSKALITGNRSRSARSVPRENSEKPLDTSRTRSVSPFLPSTPVNSSKLPLKKLHNIYGKITTQLEEVKNIMGTKSNEKLENPVDLKRYIQRADEFCIRFSRNNIYETKRTLNEIKRAVVCYPTAAPPSKEWKILCKKLTLGYHAASQSLQMYINYAKNPTSLEVPEKLKELILLIADLLMSSENVSIHSEETFVLSDVLKTCNEILISLSKKISVSEYLDLKESEANKKIFRVVSDDSKRKKKFSMYKTKVSNANWKTKPEVLGRKKNAIHSFLACKNRKMRKKDERKAKITHDIYTQNMNLNTGKALGNRNVKFEPFKVVDPDRDEVSGDKRQAVVKKAKFFTPREVISQDDDVETMVQTIADDEVMPSKISPRTLNYSDDNSENSNNFTKSSFRELLLEAIEELQNPGKKEQKGSLKKLLDSIRNCSKSQSELVQPAKVKLYHFKSKDLEEETLNEENEEPVEEEGEEEEEEIEEEKVDSKVELKKLHKELKLKEEILSGERSLKIIFKPIKPNKSEKATLDNLVPIGKIKLKLSEELIQNVNKYKKSMTEYRRSNIMYQKALANKPWHIMAKLSDRLILDIIQDISKDFENENILKNLYLNELLEVIN